ncbi:MAG: hypothetical protein JNL11_18240 [Bdellovibrionaceae bacterium]|nr:hypothetical protein [Pseudobdellovibrionaceae bacterium]
MKTRLVAVLAVLAFSGSVLAQVKAVKEANPKVREHIEKNLKQKTGEELNRSIAKDLLFVERSNANVEGMMKGLDRVFGAAEIMKKLAFGEKIKTSLLTSPTSAEYKMGFALANTLSRLDKMSESDAAASIKMVKNYEFMGMDEAVSGFAAQARAINYLTYKKYDEAPDRRIDSSTETIELVGVLNVKAKELGLENLNKRDGVILELKDVPADKLKELAEKRKKWNEDC